MKTRLKQFFLGFLTILSGVAMAATVFHVFQPATGILKGSATNYVTTAAVASDVTGLWTGSCSTINFLRGDGTCSSTSNFTLPGGTWGAGQLVNNTPGLFQDAAFSGTTTGAQAGFGGFLRQTDNSSCISSSGNACVGFYDLLILNGSGVVGGRGAGQFDLNILATTGNVSPTNYTALGSACRMSATDATTGSSCFGANLIGQIKAGVTGQNLVGTEIDVVETTTSVISGYRAGLNVVDTSASNADTQATNDFGIGINYANFNANTAGSTHGFKTGITFGMATSYFPISSTGTMIYACNNSAANAGSCAYTVGKGIDFSNGTFSTFQYSGPGFLIDGSGRLLNSTPGGSVYLGVDTAAAYDGIIINPGATASNASFLAAAGPGANLNLHFQSKGTGHISLENGVGALAADFSTGGASSVSGNYLNMGGAASGTNITSIAAAGSDTNVDLRLLSKGTRSVIAAPGTDGVAFKVQNAAFTNTYLSVNTSTNAIALGLAGTSVTMPGLASSSAATTGTLCWTTVTGNVNVDTTLACLSSTQRVKQNIQPLDAGLSEVMALRPVSYDLKPEFNPKGLGPMVGLVAEETQTVDSRLVGTDDEGKPLGVRYMQLTAVLVKAIQEQQHEIDALKRQLRHRHHETQ